MYTYTDGIPITLLPPTYPDEEVLGVIVPDSPGVWPVAGHPRGRQQRRHRLVKQEVIVDELLLLLLGHLAQGVVLA